MWLQLLVFLFMFPALCFSRDLNSILQVFEEYAEKSLKDWEAVGMAIAIVKDDQLIYTKGFGQRSLQDKQAVTPDTLFQIGSISKAFTTTLSAIAVDRALFQWKDAVIDHFPEFMLYDPWVTRQFEIEDLYAQRSGLTAYAGDTQSVLGTSIEKMIYNLRYFKPLSSFRSQFAYQNIFFSVGAEILKKRTGRTWESLLEEEIFRPLGMNNSSFSLDSYLNEENRVGWHLRQSNGELIHIPDNFDAADWIYLYKAAGGINSSAKDMANWLILQTNQGTFQGKSIVSKENLANTIRPHIYVGDVYNGINFYCLGWLYLEYSPFPIIWHNGGTSGVANNLAFIPQDKIGILVLCNTRGTLLAEALTMQFFDMYYGKENKDWSTRLLNLQKAKEAKKRQKVAAVTNPLSALPLRNYTGIYKNEVYGKAKVIVDGETLKIEIGPKSTIWTLKHVNKDTFSFQWPAGEEMSNVYFYFDNKNQPMQMVVELLQKEGQGTFIRR